MSPALPPRLDRPMTLERRRDMPDGGGGLTITWVPVATVWAEVRTVSAQETDGGFAAIGRVSHRILIRSLPQASALRPVPTDRLREGAGVFRIHAISEDARGAFLSLWAETGGVA